MDKQQAIVGLGNLTRNPKEYGKVAVLMGGESAEREVSLNSGNAVLAGLIRKGVDAHAVDVRHPEIITRLLQEKFDAAFIALHGPGDEDGAIQGLLEILRIPYTGSNLTASSIAMDKIASKRIWQALGYPVLPYEILNKGFDPKAVVAELGLPLAIKPVSQGSTVGVSKVTHIDELLPAYEKAAAFPGVVMAEPWIEGKEYTVGIVGNAILPSIYIKPAQAYYDYHAKYISDETQYFVPSGLTQEQEEYLGDITLKTYQAIGCSGWGRADFVQDNQGNFWILEMNTIPGLTDHSLVPMGVKALGLTFDDLILAILESIWPRKQTWHGIK
jgi:D-alanine-D-alanine ligase